MADDTKTIAALVDAFCPVLCHGCTPDTIGERWRTVAENLARESLRTLRRLKDEQKEKA